MSHYDAAWRAWTPPVSGVKRQNSGRNARLPPVNAPKPTKYRAEPQVLDGQRFDSKAELRRFHELLTMGRAGLLSELELHPRFPLVVNGVKVGVYTADFAYRVPNANGVFCVEDVKSPVTRKETAYRLRKKLVEALYPWTITEV